MIFVFPSFLDFGVLYVVIVFHDQTVKHSWDSRSNQKQRRKAHRKAHSELVAGLLALQV